MSSPTRAATRHVDEAPPEALFVLSAVSLYLGTSVAVLLFDRMPPGAVAWLRVSAAALIVVVARRSWRRRWTSVDLAWAAAFGTTLAAMNLSFYLAADRLDLGSGVAIEFVGPIAVAVFGARSPRNVSALALAVGGVLLLSTFGTGEQRTGVVFALLAGALWAGYIVLGSRVATGAAVDGLGVGMAFGAVAIAPFGVGGLGPIAAEPWLLGACGAVGLLSNAIPYGLDQLVLQRLPVARFALLLALLPATAVVMGLVVLGQVPSLLDALGIGLVIAAILVRDRTGEAVDPAVAEG
ncbi:MAG: DMT family transporter [Acidimicrobiales bacterium]